MERITRCLMFCGAIVACADERVEDGSLYSTGTEEDAITMANGQPGCANPKKQLVCHAPDDDPHELCVALQAIESHVIGHGDLAGPCP